MKNLFLTILCFYIFTSVFAKNPNEKTFLILFDKSELKINKTSPEYIELSLMNIFQTKSYSGNSDAAILVKTSHQQIDKCMIGDFIIRINQEKIATLDEVAFQIIDLDESKGIYQKLLANLEDKNQKSKKSNKLFKSNP
ncbi:hypothetical protein [Belliella pelovolcani]|uniref:PDZ domain-containing protein n=2 Tax=Belliella pelovolcani TaxID=529505 RepID=A0A1N7P316_9BACT|nr:hypothetical protein [Belliella pelovolcani]SIT04974.1 hypothetical protein SAMN05421761_11388 [Belliella pelovolcani]